MATLIRFAFVVVLVALSGCGDLVGFDGDVPALATMQIEVRGDFETVRVPGATGESLHVALVWGAQWLAETTCTTQPDSVELAATLAAGCRNPFAFTPNRVAGAVALEPGAIVSLPLFALPSADVMIGGLSSRIAYGSLVVFDDRDASGALELARPSRLPGNTNGPPDDGDGDLETADLIYGASFVTMTEPDSRVAFREGSFNATAAFYPRSGCGDPLPAFSVVRAGGFSLDDALAAAETGALPQQDPTLCSEAAMADTVVAIDFRANADVREVGCQQRTANGNIAYRQPPTDAPDLTGRTTACHAIPETTLVELTISGRTDDTCKGLTHYTLRGCDDAADLACEAPEWDFTATPPSWWPCGGAP